MRKVATCGTFDILHEAHKELLRKARRLGDSLAVIIVPDKIVFENKGRLPINNQEERKNNVKRLPFVNEVYIDCLSEELESLVALQPDIFVFGYDQTTQREEKLKEYLNNKGLNPEYVIIETEIKIHSSELKDDLR